MRVTRPADLLENPPTVCYMGKRPSFEMYDFSNKYVHAHVRRWTGDRHWCLTVETSGEELPRHAHDAAAEAVKMAAEAVLILNKPMRSTAADTALSNEIRVLLAERGWTFKEAAASFGIEHGRFGNLVCGQTRWTVTDLYNIAEAISDDPDEEFARLAQIGRSAFRGDN